MNAHAALLDNGQSTNKRTSVRIVLFALSNIDHSSIFVYVTHYTTEIEVMIDEFVPWSTSDAPFMGKVYKI